MAIQNQRLNLTKPRIDIRAPTLDMSALERGGAALGAGVGKMIENKQAEEMRLQNEAAAAQKAREFASMTEGSSTAYGLIKMDPSGRTDAILRKAKEYEAAGDMPNAQEMQNLALLTPAQQEKELIDDYILLEKRMNPKLTSADVANQLSGGGETRKETFKSINDLRKAVRDADPDYIKIEDSYGRIQASADEPSAAGDMALIFNYMKMLDPGSTVREGEFATAQEAAGVDQRVLSTWNKLVSGERLTPEQRVDFLGRSGKLFGSAKKRRANRTAGIVKQAKSLGLDPEMIFTTELEVAPEPVVPAPNEALMFLEQNPDKIKDFVAKYGYTPEGY